ncbi:hypothetical protein IB238_05445 [Rhizobium sp. ARZ01]|uniref:hypothetical protein n=1 Tax=Rhizobium sp. ARZ01 TaxID=2769313 RepID=UPI001782E548|nr:hypothetical protein [Rhizobium sp. ARZ01]MBD9372073.1 hypothetical protein [Rhizobium sp. ARZ01]
MDLIAAKSLLPEIREVSGLASGEWCESYDLKNQRAEVCTRDHRSGEVEPIAILLPDCSYDNRRLMRSAPVHIAALLTLLDEAFRVIRELQPKPAKAKDHAAECAMKCANDRAFRRFLQERHGADIADTERVKTRVRSILAIQSMAELNSDENARQRWKSLRAEFDNWRRG